MFKPHHRMYLVAFLMDCALMAGFTAVPFVIMRKYQGQAEMIGAISAFQSLFYAIVSLASSRFVARTDNGLRWAFAGIAGYAVLFCTACFAPNAILFCLQGMAGLGCMAFVWPALWSWMGGEPDLKERARRIAQYNICWSVGLALGPLVAGPLCRVSYWAPFAAVFALAAGAWLTLLTVPREEDCHGAHPDEDALEDHHRDYNRASEEFLYAAWLANLTGWLFVGASRSVFADRVDMLARTGALTGNAFGGDLLAEPEMVFGVLMFLVNLSRAVMFFAMGATRIWQHRFWPFVVFHILAGAALYGLGTTHNVAVMALCCFAIGLNGGVGFVAAVSYSLANPKRKHGRAAVNECMVGGGSATGALGFGLLAGSSSVSMAFQHGPWVVAAAVAAEAWLLRYGRRRLGAGGRADAG